MIESLPQGKGAGQTGPQLLDLGPRIEENGKRFLAFAKDGWRVGSFYFHRCVSALSLSTGTGHLFGGEDTDMTKARSLSRDRVWRGRQKNTQVTYMVIYSFNKHVWTSMSDQAPIYALGSVKGKHSPPVCVSYSQLSTPSLLTPALWGLHTLSNSMTPAGCPII